MSFRFNPLDGIYSEISKKDKDGNVVLIKMWNNKKRNKLLYVKKISYINNRPVLVETTNMTTKERTKKEILYNKSGDIIGVFVT